MAVIRWIKEHAAAMLTYEKRPRQLALACAVGFYIAFSPFVGLHTAMIFAASWLFGLSFPVIFLVSTIIHNPWTMVPVYGAGYLFGVWMLDFWAINHYAYNPSWVTYVSNWIAPHLGVSKVSLAAFLVGGNVIGIIGAIMLYPVIFKIVERLQLPAAQETLIEGAYADHTPEHKPSVLNRVIPAAQLRKRGYEAGSSK